MKTECSNVGLQHHIMIEVMKSGSRGQPLKLNADLAAHGESCAACAQLLPSWIKNSASLKRFDEEGELMERGATGDPSVSRRRVKSGTALFSPPTDEASRGLMVVVGDRSPYDLRLVKRLTRKEFEDWEEE
jgi:hypothetical protein